VFVQVITGKVKDAEAAKAKQEEWVTDVRPEVDD
jgi:hypothetical protein